MKNIMRKLALFLAAALCVSCLFAGMAMAKDTAAPTEEAAAPAKDAAAPAAEDESAGEEGESVGEGESSEEASAALIAALISSLGESEDGQAAEGESPEGESPEGESPEGESPEGESPEGEVPAGESAEGESAEGDSMGMMLSLFGIEFDSEAFYGDLNERLENGETLTVEDVIPQEFFDFFNSMFNPDTEEEQPYTVEMGAEENDMYFNWVFHEVVDEEGVEQIVGSVKESFESDETKAELLNAMESLSDSYGIDINDITMSMTFLNGDDTVIYVKVYTYEDLAEAAAEAAVEEVVEEAVAEAAVEEAVEEAVAEAVVEEAVEEAVAEAAVEAAVEEAAAEKETKK